jgi:hypothetical protein
MPNYARLNADATVVLATATADNLPGAGWLPLTIDAQPNYDPATQLVQPLGYIIEPTQVRKTWQVVAKPAPVVPAEVTNAQIRAALIDFGVMPSVVMGAINAIADEPTREKARAWWEYANVMRRDNPLLNSMAAQLGMSSAQVDALFVHAENQA